jgi:integrase
MRFRLSNLTCASVSIEPSSGPTIARPRRAAATGKSNCRRPAKVIVADQESFIDHKRKTQAWDQRTFERTGADLRRFAAEQPDSPIALVGVPWVRSYLGRIADLALASQRSRFHAVSEFLGWCEKRGYLKSNPAKALDRSELPWVGKRARRKVGRGKPQLRNGAEVGAYLKAAAALDSPKDRVAAVLPLLTGLRSGAVRHLRVADVDFVAGRIWSRDIDEDEDLPVEWDVKTAAGRMTVEIPELVLPDLRALCGGGAPNSFVFPSNRNKDMKGGPHDRKWLNRLVHRVCRAAGTKDVCAHGLRDTYTSLMAALGSKSAAEIAKLVGHDDDGQTAKRHYIGVPEHRPALTVLDGGRTE